ncbi:hypothetical protein MKW94_009235 [Papaver nudicaule]|uniref:Uncharacterized protein n=1 Tax=Papaver nudicaule TaxID=74823 RepID=A0AA41W192_PAPNU|nr:hypothetical protein [Papaver nudicaule]
MEQLLGKEACTGKSQEKLLMDEKEDYVLARMTVDQVLAAETAYENRFNDMLPHGFIGYCAPVKTSDECGMGEDEKEAVTSVKEKFEDLLISE